MNIFHTRSAEDLLLRFGSVSHLEISALAGCVYAPDGTLIQPLPAERRAAIAAEIAASSGHLRGYDAVVRDELLAAL